MNWDIVEGKWDEFKGKVKSTWGKLTDDDLKVIGGKKDQLLGRIQAHYGYSKDQAEKEIDKFLARDKGGSSCSTSTGSKCS